MEASWAQMAPVLAEIVRLPRADWPKTATSVGSNPHRSGVSGVARSLLSLRGV